MKGVLILAFGLLPLCLCAQLRGKVLEESSQSPLPFTTISVEGYGRGTVSNSDGIYLLNLDGLHEEAIVRFSYMGYESQRLPVSKLITNPDVVLRPTVINLQAVQVSKHQLTAEEIVEKVRINYPVNHAKTTSKQRVFLHKYERTPFPKSANAIKVKDSDFTGLDKSTIVEILGMLPEEFIEYRDQTLDLYQRKTERKVVPLEGISLEEGSIAALGNEIEQKLKTFIEDIRATDKNEKQYFKFRTGIFAFDMDNNGEFSENTEADSLHYTIPTDVIKGELGFLLGSFTDLGSKNWEFISDPGKYVYTREPMTVHQDELVYVISFKPKRSGDFEGRMYVSAMSYAILQMDFRFSTGVETERFKLLGFQHAMKSKSCRVVFEKGEKSYHLKYLNVYQNEFGAVDRNFTIMKKEKRFLFDKSLNEVSFETDIAFDIHTYWELLVVEHQEISDKVFEKIEQPKNLKLKKEYAYSPDAWNGTALVPAGELKGFRRE